MVPAHVLNECVGILSTIGTCGLCQDSCAIDVSDEFTTSEIKGLHDVMPLVVVDDWSAIDTASRVIHGESNFTGVGYPAPLDVAIARTFTAKDNRRTPVVAITAYLRGLHPEL